MVRLAIVDLNKISQKNIKGTIVHTESPIATKDDWKILKKIIIHIARMQPPHYPEDFCKARSSGAQRTNMIRSKTARNAISFN